MYTDPIADYLTRVRNAVAANHKVVEIPASNLKKEITKILFDQGYISRFLVFFAIGKFYIKGIRIYIQWQ